MKKIKILLFSFLALFVVSLSVVGVNAEEERYGTYTVSNEGKKAVWDFTKNTPSQAYTINTVSDPTVYGIGGSGDAISISPYGYLSNSGAVAQSFYIPVPSADAAGTIAYTGGNDSRYVYLTDNTIEENKIYALKNGNNATKFTSADVKTKEGHYYLELICDTYEDKWSGSPVVYDPQIKNITIVLTTGAYEVPLTFTANIYQQEGTKDDTTFVRYITIVEGLEEADLEYTLNIKCGSVDFNANCVVATRLTNNGETYVAEINGAEYTFDEKTGTLYIICVLAVKDAEHTEFVGQEITATMTVNGKTLAAKTHTIA